MMKTTVAVVEDNPDNSLLMAAILRDRYRIVAYDDGFKALEAMKVSPPDIVVMDISLPRIDGIQVLKIMKNEPVLSRIPVIALTAYAMKGNHEKFIQDGFDGYLSKPLVDFEILYKMIEDLIGKTV